MKRIASYVALSSALTALPGAATAGSLELVSQDLMQEIGAVAMADERLSDMRGGYMGIAFSVFFSGSYDRMSAPNVSGQAPQAAPPPNVNVGTDGQVRVSTIVGSFQGASGIFQIAQVPGNYNIVNNNLFVQVALVNLVGAELPNMASLFSGIPR